MPAWKCSDKCYLKDKNKQIIDYRVDVSNEIPESKIEFFNKYENFILIAEILAYNPSFKTIVQVHSHEVETI